MTDEAVVLADNPGLLRQRRNLLTMSAALIFIEWAGLTFSSTVGAAGFIANVSNPSAISGALRIVWWYWLYRYYLYYEEAGVGKKFTEIREMERKVVVKSSLTRITPLDTELAETIKNEQAKGRRYAGADCEMIESVCLQPRILGCAQGWVIHISGFCVTYCDDKGGIANVGGANDLRIPGNEFRVYEWRALLSSLFRHPHLTQYWLPFFLSIPVIVLIWIEAMKAIWSLAIL